MSRIERASHVVWLAAAGLGLVLVIWAPVHAQAQPANPPAIPLAPVYIDDSTLDGAVIGALAGVGTGILVIGTRYAYCSEGCSGSSEPSWAVGAVAGGGIGAAVGWLIDKVRRDPAPSPVGVTIRADNQERAVRIQWRF
jgi:outer membrane lipoprotein SlyB